MYVDTSFGLAAKFNGRTKAYVYVPRTLYRNLTSGLCGNNDGDANNDWTLQNGTDVRGKVHAPNLLGDSFVVQDLESTDLR